MKKFIFYYLFRDFFTYGMGDIVLKVTTFITLPLYTRIFNPGDYGIWSFVNTIIGLLSGILILGGDSAYARFYFEAKTLGERQLITSTWFGFLALWSIGAILLCLPFSGFFSSWSFGTSQYRLLFVFAFLSIPISLINTMCGQTLRNQFRASLFTALNILSSVLNIGFGISAVVILKLGLVGLLGGFFLAALVMLPIRLWTARHMLQPVFSMSVLRNMLKFGISLVPTSLAYWVFASSDRIVLGKLSTLDQLGLYSIASATTSVLTLVHGAFGQAWSPHAIRMYEEEPNVASMFFGQVMTYLLVSFGFLSVCITTFGPEVLMIVSTPTFYPAASAIAPLALGFIAYSSTQVTAVGISLTKKTKFFALYSWMAALLNLTLNILFVPRWGMMAASWSTALSYTFLTVAYALTSQRLWHVTYEKKRILRASILTIAFTGAIPFFPESMFTVGLIWKSSYCLTFIGLLFVLQVLDKREWAAFSSLMQRKIFVTGKV
jgi:O-antigen/teichoic acid export membrane protein